MFQQRAERDRPETALRPIMQVKASTVGKKTKAERQRDAQLQATERVGKQLLSLSLALLRVGAVSEALRPVAAQLAKRAESEDQLRDEAVAATARLENSDLTRADGLLSLTFAALYAVVEKWRKWKFSDPEVDRLLRSPNVTLLENHRHAVFHADHYDDEGIRRFAEQQGITDWADELATAIRKALRGWHDDPVPHMEAHLGRLGHK